MAHEPLLGVAMSIELAAVLKVAFLDPLFREERVEKS